MEWLIARSKEGSTAPSRRNVVACLAVAFARNHENKNPYNKNPTVRKKNYYISK